MGIGLFWAGGGRGSCGRLGYGDGATARAPAAHRFLQEGRPTSGRCAAPRGRRAHTNTRGPSGRADERGRASERATTRQAAMARQWPSVGASEGDPGRREFSLHGGKPLLLRASALLAGGTSTDSRSRREPAGAGGGPRPGGRRSRVIGPPTPRECGRGLRRDPGLRTLRGSSDSALSLAVTFLRSEDAPSPPTSLFTLWPEAGPGRPGRGSLATRYI
jgi:hypothetical protein